MRAKNGQQYRIAETLTDVKKHISLSNHTKWLIA
jgi:hypothetical protein